MYLSFYNLNQKPFQISTDPKFLWLGEKHKEALATLRYGILDNKGFLLLTGDIGTGKTTLINSLLRTLNKDILVATIRDPDLEPLDFFNYIAHVFGMEGEISSKGAFLIKFENFLLEAYKSKKKVLLIIDEAQRINQKLLEEVRLLSNIEKAENKLLNIFFVGQIEFNDQLLQPENRAIRQRITVNYNIANLSEKETRLYIKHRLEIAATSRKGPGSIPIYSGEKSSKSDVKHQISHKKEDLFSDSAIEEIYSFSKGYPRLINIVCDRSLLTGFVEEAKIIVGKHVKECIEELTIPNFNNQHDPIPTPPLPQNDDESTQFNSKSTPIEEKTSFRLKDNILKNIVVIFCFLLLLLICWIGFFKVQFNILQGQSLFEFSVALLQQTSEETSDDKVINIKSPVESSELSGLEPQIQEGITHDNKNIDEPDSLAPLDRKIVTTPIDSQSPLPVSRSKMKPQSTSESSNSSQKSLDTPSNSQILENNKAEEMSLPPKSNDSEYDSAITPAIEVKPLETFNKLTIPFPSNSNFPPDDALESLNSLVDSLIQHQSVQVFITGFTDTAGNEAFNVKLSEFRANSIKIYMVGRGLDATKIKTRGLGSKSPIASNDTVAGRTINRRVEVEIDF